MRKQRILKLIHLLSTCWFGLCVVYILILAMRQAGVKWWVIFSLSGHSAVFVFLMVSLYLFAIFRGGTRSKIVEQEYPLTSTYYYMAFYTITPFLGGLAGIGGVVSLKDMNQCLLSIAYGSTGVTFLVWIIVDPVIGVIENLLPASRQHRKLRLEQARLRKEKEQREKQLLLEKLQSDEKELRSKRQNKLEPLSLKLVELVSGNGKDLKKREYEVVDIGVMAWQIGGLDSMQQLHEMTIQQLMNTNEKPPAFCYISVWWDGIGQWRHHPLSKKDVLLGD
ncbi:MAG: hypothetical protein JW860_08795 [Sedimentisphaerales bacterium]|nr:hypothetical protein [Sedimentisphaerales bacterium]